jgi:hypothetical protein
MTNQASEDELKVLLESNGWKFYEELNGFRKESKYTIPMFSTDQHTNYDKLSAGNYYELKQAVQSAIRTEKLKLLAEVRERVVGEDEPGVTNIMIAAEHAEQRNVLTKLEAEL